MKGIAAVTALDQGAAADDGQPSIRWTMPSLTLTI